MFISDLNSVSSFSSNIYIFFYFRFSLNISILFLIVVLFNKNNTAGKKRPKNMIELIIHKKVGY